MHFSVLNLSLKRSSPGRSTLPELSCSLLAQVTSGGQKGKSIYQVEKDERLIAMEVMPGLLAKELVIQT